MLKNFALCSGSPEQRAIENDTAFGGVTEKEPYAFLNFCSTVLQQI